MDTHVYLDCGCLIHDTDTCHCIKAQDEECHEDSLCCEEADCQGEDQADVVVGHDHHLREQENRHW